MAAAATGLVHAALFALSWQIFCNNLVSHAIGETGIPLAANIVVHHKLVCVSEIQVRVFDLSERSCQGFVLLGHILICVEFS